MVRRGSLLNVVGAGKQLPDGALSRAVLLRDLHQIVGDGCRLVPADVGDDLERALEGSGALLQRRDELLLALLVEIELVMMAHTHPHEALAQLLTVFGYSLDTA